MPRATFGRDRGFTLVIELLIVLVCSFIIVFKALDSSSTCSDTAFFQVMGHIV